MSVIEFLCPNGHKIRCQADQAGQPAKCPRCGVKFRVPDANELESGGSDALSKLDFNEYGLAGEPPPQIPDPAISANPGSPLGSNAKKGAQMEFLCPNGHRLFGSAALAGRPGQCPDCGSRFRIPTFEDVFIEQNVEPIIHAVGPANGQPTSAAVAVAPRDPQTQPSQNQPQPAWSGDAVPASVWSVASGSALAEQPLATLFAKLWTTRPKGTRVELLLRDGEMVVVERFMAALSQQTHGVFGFKATDSTYTLMAVPWESVTRVLVRGLLELPKS